MIEKINGLITRVFPISIKGFLVFMLLTAGISALFFQLMKGNSLEDSRSVTEFASLYLFILVIFVLWLSYRIHARLDWFISASVSKFRQIEQAQAQLQSEPEAQVSVAKVDLPTPHWPWGSHHTEALGHLEAAAVRFWSLFDPDDASTAPTNEMVADWLRSERGVSKERAQQIASILRADGLKAGPRR